MWGKGNWRRAAGTALARTITPSWSTTFHLPTKIVEPNLTTTFTFDAKATYLTKSVTEHAYAHLDLYLQQPRSGTNRRRLRPDLSGGKVRISVTQISGMRTSWRQTSQGRRCIEPILREHSCRKPNLLERISPRQILPGVTCITPTLHSRISVAQALSESRRGKSRFGRSYRVPVGSN
jgi:hypothetical protein